MRSARTNPADARLDEETTFATPAQYPISEMEKGESNPVLLRYGLMAKEAQEEREALAIEIRTLLEAKNPDALRFFEGREMPPPVDRAELNAFRRWAAEETLSRSERDLLAAFVEGALRRCDTMQSTTPEELRWLRDNSAFEPRTGAAPDPHDADVARMFEALRERAELLKVGVGTFFIVVRPV
eukprot:TRINITY_DN1321_c0_g1_i13.p4 TRINITY_DN1321_c0_g1~~TRINITY_DN1321_c0_g1_i13.p4  ORF type:complete len:184 (-),score=35.61 TRINITY_DN1321_c0_g1_i13:1405-1956(-)